MATRPIAPLEKRNPAELRLLIKEQSRKIRSLEAHLLQKEEDEGDEITRKGVGLRPAVSELWEHNYPTVEDAIDSIPAIPFLCHRDKNGEPDGPPMGWDAAVEHVKSKVGAVVSQLSVAEISSAEAAGYDHVAFQLLMSEPAIYQLFRGPRDRVGLLARGALKTAVRQFGLGPAQRLAFLLAKEVQIEPLWAAESGRRSP